MPFVITPLLETGFWGYALAGFTLCVLATLLAVAPEKNHSGRWLILAASVNAAWSIVMAVDAYRGLPITLLYWAELCKALAWIFLLQHVGRRAIHAGLDRLLNVGMATLAALAVLVTFGVRQDLLRPGNLLCVQGIVLALAVLSLLEQVFRNGDAQTRWRLRYLVLGLGSVYAFDLFLYAQASVVRNLDAFTWQARGFVNALLLPLMLISARRNPDWRLDVYVSRHITLYTGAVIGVGVYAMLVSLGASLAVRLGGFWGAFLKAALLAIAAGMLLLLVASGSVRRRSRVFLSKHFYRNKYDYRLEWMRFVKTMSSASHLSLGETSVRAVAQALDSPGGALLIPDRDERYLVFHAAWPLQLDCAHCMEHLDMRGAFAGYLVKSRWIIDLQEYHSNPRRYDNVAIPGWLADATSFRLLVPLVLGHRLLGLLCLQQPPPPFALSYEDRDLLKTVSQHIATHIAQFLADQSLAESRQFQAHGKLAAFMMHDLKNSVAQLQLLIENAARHKRDPEFIDDAITTTGNVVERINRLIAQLHGRLEPAQKQLFAVDKLIAEVAARALRKPLPRVVPSDGTCLVEADRQRLAAILEHAIRNAQDATPESGTVTVSVSQLGATARIAITDTGAGMTAQFIRDRLFRPFESTKGVKGMGIGAYQIREYARELGGDVEVVSAPNQGTTLHIILPRGEKLLEGTG